MQSFQLVRIWQTGNFKREFKPLNAARRQKERLVILRVEVEEERKKQEKRETKTEKEKGQKESRSKEPNGKTHDHTGRSPTRKKA